jgi:hypothetical protein
MSHADDIKRLIAIHQRRLQKRKEQQAAYGLSAPPEILIEIEDIEAELAHLHANLAAAHTAEPDGQPSWPERQRLALALQQSALIEDYEALNEALTSETDPVNRRRYKRRMAGLEEELTAVTGQLNRLEKQLKQVDQPDAAIKTLRQTVKVVAGPVSLALTGDSWQPLRQHLLTQASKLPHANYLDTDLLAEKAGDMARLTRETQHVLAAHKMYPGQTTLAGIRQHGQKLTHYLQRIYRLAPAEWPQLTALAAEES